MSGRNGVKRRVKPRSNWKTSPLEAQRLPGEQQPQIWIVSRRRVADFSNGMPWKLLDHQLAAGPEPGDGPAVRRSRRAW